MLLFNNKSSLFKIGLYRHNNMGDPNHIYNKFREGEGSEVGEVGANCIISIVL